MAAQFVGIDWGTSNRRAYVYSAHGDCLRQLEDDQGMLAARGRFAESLDALLSQLDVPLDSTVLMSGMVGSAQGWREVAYLDPAVPLLALPSYLTRVDGQRFIVPGYHQHSDLADVMRGEETQLLGLVASGMHSGWAVLPGTHSKWVHLDQGRISQWATYMTGELFSLVAQQGTLAALLSSGAADDPEGFAAGVALARRALPLSRTLFTVRASVVSGSMPASQARAMVSGLLIGSEFAAMRASGLPCTEITLLASPAVRANYQTAARAFGIEVTAPDTHGLYGTAMRHLYQYGGKHAA
jgi:2-dehydro-3-deoxygalactonokinase